MKKPMLLLRDKARPHTSAAPSVEIASIWYKVVSGLHYSPHLALSDFRLFTTLTKHQEFIPQMLKKFRVWQNGIEKSGQFYSDRFKKAVKRWWRTEEEEDCVQKLMISVNDSEPVWC